VAPIIDKLVSRIQGAEGGLVNLSDYFDCVTLDIIGALSFGADFGMLNHLTEHPFLHVLPDVGAMVGYCRCSSDVV
jgi:hypothetical protein